MACCCLRGGQNDDERVDPSQGAWLRKRSRHGRWDRRFAVVADHRLLFHHHKRDAADEGASPSFMKLAGCTVKSAGGGARFEFLVAHALHDDERHFRAGNEKQKRAWMKHLKAAIAQATEADDGDGGGGPGCVEGWLYKKGGTTVRAAGARRDTVNVSRTGMRHNWRRRWFELRGATPVPTTHTIF